jgi:subtilisin family serine protease
MDLLESTAAPVGGSRTGCLGRAIQILLFLAVLTIAFSGQLWAWVGSVVAGGEVSPAQVTAVQAVLTAGLLLPFALAWRPQRERAIYRTWLLAALYPLLMAATRLLDPTRSAEVTLLQLGVTGVFALALYALLRRRPGDSIAHSAGPAWGLALAAAAIAAAPWVMCGALGSPEEAVLSLLLGLAFGAAVSLLLTLFWWPSLQEDSRGRRSDIFTGGLVAGAAMAVMSSGLSLNGLQLVLMFALPSLGFAAAALAYAHGGFDWRPPTLLLGPPAAAALAFTDVGPLAVEAGDPALAWAWQAALIAALLGWLLAFAALIWRRRWGAGGRALSTLVQAATLWVVVVALYFFAGQPGFYGDRLFVILRSQADVASAAQLEDYGARRQAVYTTLVEHASATQADLRGVLDRWGLHHTSYYLVNAVEVEGGLLARLLLARQADVDRILPSPRLRPLPGPLDAGAALAGLPDDHRWNLVQIGATRAWGELGARGAGIVVGASDSGVDVAHPELADGYLGRDGSHDYAWFDPWSHTPAPVDYGGHGTHTLATVTGNATGVAPDAMWIACANLQRNLGNPALYLDCLQFMLAPFPTGGDPFADGDPLRSAHVLNNSWGCPQEHEGCDATSLEGAVDALRAAGIFVVASAGNDGPACGTIADPIALYDAVFTVGAVDRYDNLAAFSSAGPVIADGSGRTKPDLAAPGVDVWSAYPGGQYAAMSGTSMAGPHVAGVVALMWSANPGLIGDIDRTEQILRETAHPFSGSMEGIRGSVADEDAPVEDLPLEPSASLDALYSSGGACIRAVGSSQRPNNLVGFGIVDAFAAVQRALAAP